MYILMNGKYLISVIGGPNLKYETK